MAEYTLRVRRYDPESGKAPWYQDYQVQSRPDRNRYSLYISGKEDGQEKEEQ